jgi:hypothetical protein
MYQRKTKDVWEVQGNYGYGWEMVTTEESRSDAKKQLACYDENEPNVPHRLKMVREKIEEEEQEL